MASANRQAAVLFESFQPMSDKKNVVTAIHGKDMNIAPNFNEM
jgi:hypothetical protein